LHEEKLVFKILEGKTYQGPGLMKTLSST